MSMQPLILNNYSVNNTAEGVDIYIDGYIVDAPTQQMMREFLGDETSVSYKSVRDQVNAAKPKEVNVYVNSGGGQVVDAMAMHDFFIDLENKGVKVNRYGRGIIASAATYLLMGKNSSISENSWFMIHNVSGGVFGDVNDIENAAKTMRKFNNQVRDLYVNYTGSPAETISAWMNKETWFTGKEAVEKKFVENVTGKVEFKNSIKAESWPFSNRTVLNAYNNSVIHNSPDMNIKEIANKILDEVKKALNLSDDKKVTDLKPEDLQNAISNGITASLNAINDEISKSVSTAITDALKEDGAITKAVNAAIDAAVKEALKNEGSIGKSISDAIKDLATAKSVEDLEKDIVDKLAGKGKPKKEKEDDKDPNNHSGINWGNSNSADDDE